MALASRVQREGGDLVLRIVGGQDRIRIEGQATASQPPIDRVTFANGAQWSAADLMVQSVTADAAERRLNPAVAGTDPFAAAPFAGAPGGGNPGGGGGGGNEEGVGSGTGLLTLTGTSGRDTYRRFVPLSSDDDSVITITDFQVGDSGDILDIRNAAGLPGRSSSVSKAATPTSISQRPASRASTEPASCCGSTASPQAN